MEKNRIIFVISGIVLMAFLVFATTTISNNGITTPTINGDLNMSTANANLRFFADRNQDSFSDGSSIEFYSLDGEAKPYLGWWAYNPVTDDTRGIGWFGCHYNLTNGDEHQHCSLETWDNTTNTINTRFECNYGEEVSDMYCKVSSVGNFILGNDVDLQLTGEGGDIEGNTVIDVYPNNQATFALSITNKSDGIKIYSSGGDNIYVGDDLYFDSDAYDIRHSGNMDIFPDGQTTIGLSIDQDGSNLILNGLGTSNIQFQDKIQIGLGIAQTNITLTSPDGTEFTCGVNNSGTLSCS